VGRHAAADGAPADPLVAAALIRRAAVATRSDAGEESGLGGLGWPGPPAPGDGRTGWPGGVDDVPAAPTPEAAPVTQPVAEPAAEPAPAEGRRGWWRLFGQGAA
jgi:hypothetical protein